jgi:membrane protein DedA with SNARE-associated domain
MDSFVPQLVEFVGGLHPVLQFLAVFGIGLVPFLESHFGAFVGTLTGVPVVLAALAAIVGNLLAVAVGVRAGSAVQRKVASRRGEPSKRARKVLDKVDRFGVPVASLLGPFVMATAISTFAMIGAGLNRRAVILWQAIAVTVWGVVFAALASGVIAFVG